MKLTAKTAFSWAHQGVRVEHFDEGQEIDTDDDDLIDVATREGWVDGNGKKAAKSAPERQAAKGAPETK